MSKQAANCPRCGYDLTGTVATWTKQCPLTGRCNECGLDVDWPSVFATSFHPWLFEYHWKRKPFSRFFKTILKAFQPRRFWSEVELTDPVHLLPATVITLILVSATALLLIASVVIPEYADYQWQLAIGYTPGWSFWFEKISDAAIHVPLEIIKLTPGLPAALFAMPVIFFLIPTTLRKARVKSSHIFRIFFYSLVAPIAIACLWSALFLVLQELDYYKATRIINPNHWRNRHTTSVIVIFIYQLLPGMALVIPCTVWMAYWWHSACKQYLKLKETRLIIILLTVILFLFATILEIVFA